MKVLELIAEVHESGEFAVRHREGEFENDKERWTAAAKLVAYGYRGIPNSPILDTDNSIHDYIKYNIHEFWKIYTKAILIS